MPVSFIEFFTLVSHLSSTIPLLVYLLIVLLLSFKQAPRFIHSVALICLISLIADTFSRSLYNTGRNTGLVFNLHDILHFTLLCILYYDLIFKKTNKVYFIIGLVVYAVSCIGAILFYKSIFEYQHYVWALQCLIGLFFTILCSRYLLLNALKAPDHIDGKLWINGANLFYFSFSFWLFVMLNLLLTEVPIETTKAIWTFHNFNNIVKNLLFAVGLYYTSKPSTVKA